MKSFEKKYSCVECVDEFDMYSELQANAGLNPEIESSKILPLVNKEVASVCNNTSDLINASPTSTKESIRMPSHAMLSEVLERLKMRVSPASLSEIDKDNDSDEDNGSLTMNWDEFEYLETSIDFLRHDDNLKHEVNNYNIGIASEKCVSISAKHGNSNCCTACGQRFSSKASLQRHYRVHSGEKPYKCHICSRDFTQSGSLKRHLQTVHKNDLKELQPIKPLESKHFQNDFDVEDTMGKNDKDTILTSPEATRLGSLKCQYCKVQFDSLRSLTMHEKTHTAQKTQYSCEHCGMCFSGKSHLNRHMPVHSVKTPYKCEICKITFRLKVSLTAHIRKCHDESLMLGYLENMSSSDRHTATPKINQQFEVKPYKCDVCNTTFQLHSSLVKHEVHHNFGKPLKCTTCGVHFKKTTALKNHLKTHKKTKALRIQHECSVCGNSYRYANRLKKHMTSHSEDKMLCDGSMLMTA